MDPNNATLTQAVKRAPARRLAYELAHATWILQKSAGEPRLLRQAHLLGAYEAAGSLTLKACLLTAWGW